MILFFFHFKYRSVVFMLDFLDFLDFFNECFYHGSINFYHIHIFPSVLINHHHCHAFKGNSIFFSLTGQNHDPPFCFTVACQKIGQC